MQPVLTHVLGTFGFLRLQGIRAQKALIQHSPKMR